MVLDRAADMLENLTRNGASVPVKGLREPSKSSGGLCISNHTTFAQRFQVSLGHVGADPIIVKP